MKSLRKYKKMRGVPKYAKPRARAGPSLQSPPRAEISSEGLDCLDSRWVAASGNEAT